VQVHKSLVCKIGGEWGVLNKARRLVEWQCLILAVTEERDNNMIYLRFVRGPCDDGEYLSSVNNLIIGQAEDTVFFWEGFVLLSTLSIFYYFLVLVCWIYYMTLISFSGLHQNLVVILTWLNKTSTSLRHKWLSLKSRL